MCCASVVDSRKTATSEGKLTTYTHRNIHTGDLCYIQREETVLGHILYFVRGQCLGMETEEIWPAELFKTHHVEVEQVERNHAA